MFHHIYIYIDYQGHQDSCIPSISLTVQHNHINQTTTSSYPVLLFYLHLLQHLELLRRWLGLPWRASSCYSEIRFLGICWALSYTGFIVCFSYLYRVNPSRSLLLHIAQSYRCSLHCTRFTFWNHTSFVTAMRCPTVKHGHYLPEKNPRLTFTAELFLRAIFKYQIEVFGEHELIFLVVPKIVTTMTLGMEDLKQKDMSPCPVWPVSLQVKLKYWYVLRRCFKDV